MTPYNQYICIDGTSYGQNVAAGATDLTDLANPLGIATNPFQPDTQQKTHRKEAEMRRQKTETRRYETGVRDVLNRIKCTQCGNAVMCEIGRFGRHVTITPYLPSDQDWNNGSARPSDAQAATRKRWLLRDGDGDPSDSRKRGTGMGSDSVIEFITPHLARRINRNLPVAVKSSWKKGGDPNSLAFEDEILVHELVHAARHTTGSRIRRRVPRQPHYDNIEEFYAIVVANIYRSECGRSGVRNSNHGGHELMFVSGEGFLKLHFNRMHLRRFRRQHDTLVKKLKEINTYFNPFRHMLL